MTSAFLAEVYERIADGRVASATDAVIDHVDRLLNAGAWAECDELLRNADQDRMPSSVRRAFLAVTWHGKQELSARAAFYDEALRLLSRERGDETARKWLRTLA